jgi:hypothetical protein
MLCNVHLGRNVGENDQQAPLPLTLYSCPGGKREAIRSVHVRHFPRSSQIGGKEQTSNVGVHVGNESNERCPASEMKSTKWSTGEI